VHGRKRKKKEKEKEEEKEKEKKGKALYAEAAALLARTENTRDSRAREDQTQTEKRWRQYAETELAAQFGLTKVSGGTCDTKLSKRCLASTPILPKRSIMKAVNLQETDAEEGPCFASLLAAA